MNILEGIARQALQHPRKTALIAAGANVSYRVLMATVEQVAARLSEEGVVRGDRVGLVAPGLKAHVTVTLALAHLGAVSVPLPASGPGDSCDDVDMKFLVGHDAAAPERVKWLPLTELDRAPASAVPPRVAVDAGEIWRIAQSSGTTGRPKLIAFTHGQALQRCHLAGSGFGALSDQRTMLCLGLNLAFATGHWLRVLHHGGTLVAHGPGGPSEILQVMAAQEVAVLVSTPSFAVPLAEAAAALPTPLPLPRLQALWLGGAAVSRRLIATLRRHVCPNVYNTYGATETGGIAVADAQLLAAEPDCAGRLLPWVEAQALGSDGVPLPAGESGRLRVRSPVMASGYMGDASVPAEGGYWQDGWFYSADIGAVAADGRLYLEGRQNDVLNVSGVKVQPARIEAVIQADPAILECAVVDVPANLGQPVLAAVLVASGEVDAEALKARCRQALGDTLAPRLVLQVDRMPRNEAGKIAREEVRRMVAGARRGSGTGAPA